MAELLGEIAVTAVRVQASGRFEARPFVRDDVWLVAAVYTPAPVDQ